MTTNPKTPVVHHKPAQPNLTCIEICSGAGGQALGLERAGFARSAECRVIRRR
jgi:DNA (cytosine-5)-methyltransferase 1